MKQCEKVKNMTNSIYVPAVDPNYVRFGNYEDVKRIIESRNFFPVWIHGLSGNGKTQMIKQACAETGREFIRFNFTAETDEGDCFGRQSLVETETGATVTQFKEGPITIAMRRGAVVLLDELDVGHTNRIMALQSVLEGEGVLLKETNEYLRPTPGFQIFATGNTKGTGSENGKFIGTQILNAAMRDRFAAMLFQDYPDVATETAILSNYFVDYMWLSKGVPLNDIPAAEAAEGNEFIQKLCEWSKQIRDTHNAGGVDELITTRSLINIVKGYSIFGDRQKSLTWACERYPNDVRDQFIQIYDKLNADVTLEATSSGDTRYQDFVQSSF